MSWSELYTRKNLTIYGTTTPTVSLPGSIIGHMKSQTNLQYASIPSILLHEVLYFCKTCWSNIHVYTIVPTWIVLQKFSMDNSCPMI